MTPRYKTYALGLLTAIYATNLLDRSLMSLLLQPIKHDLHLSDTQLGFITGIAFALFYATLGVPIGRWADRGNRVTIASAAIALWSVTVMAVMLVTSYAQMVAARMAAAVGESGCKPPTYSLVGDYFPRPQERTRAMSIYWAGGTFAPLVGFSLGGWLNDLYGWRMTFLLMSLPGLILALVVKLTLIEPRPPRGCINGRADSFPSTRDVLRVLWRQRACRHLTIALILLFTMVFALDPWRAAFMMRSHGMESGELGLWLGPIYSVSGGVGVLLGGYVVNRWFANDERGQMRLCAIMVAIAGACYIAFLGVPIKELALLLLIPLMACLAMFMAPAYTLMQRLVPDEMRATAMATVMLLYNLVGMGVGPQVVGILSDAFASFAGIDSLRYAMSVMSFVAFWSAYHFWRVGTNAGHDLAAVASLSRVENVDSDSAVHRAI